MVDQLPLSPSDAGLLQVHFYLKDNAHAMDAMVLHRCEGDVFDLITEVSRHLGVELSIENTAYTEGGLVVLLKLVGEHAAALTIIGTAVTAICGATAWMVYQRPLMKQQITQNDFALHRDRKLADQQQELNDLAIKKARLELRKMAQETAPDGPKAPSNSATKALPLEPPVTAESVIPALLAKPKITKIRSDFYTHLLGAEKITAVGFSAGHDVRRKHEDVVPRSAFSTYVLPSNNYDSKVLEDIEVEIISPVLSGDDYKWKGIIETGGINFDLEDEEFLHKVKLKKVKFQSGTTLVCDLEIHFKDDSFGEPEPCRYVVTHVSRNYNKRNKSSKPALQLPDESRATLLHELKIAELPAQPKQLKQQEIPLLSWKE